jgi:hypothetical protein
MTTTSFSTQDAGAGIMAALTEPNAPRAVLVSLNRDGQLELAPVGDGQSLVNIKDELIDHLNNYPHSDEWLTGLRDYCDNRLTARRKARETGGFSLPMKDGGWDVVQPVPMTQGRA